MTLLGRRTLFQGVGIGSNPICATKINSAETLHSRGARRNGIALLMQLSAGSTPVPGAIFCPVVQLAVTPDSESGDRGSSPRGAAKFYSRMAERLRRQTLNLFQVGSTPTPAAIFAGIAEC